MTPALTLLAIPLVACLIVAFDMWLNGWKRDALWLLAGAGYFALVAALVGGM